MELLILIIWLLCGFVSMGIASSKGRSGCGWGLLGFLFGPLGVLAAAVISPDEDAKKARFERAGVQSGDLVKCPACAELIKREAIKCRYCGTEIVRHDAP